MKYSCMSWSSSRSASYCSPSFSMQHRKFICNVFLLFFSFVKARVLCVSFVERTKSFSPSTLTRRNASNVEPSFTSKKTHFLNYQNGIEFILPSVLYLPFLFPPPWIVEYTSSKQKVQSTPQQRIPWLLIIVFGRSTQKSALCEPSWWLPTYVRFLWLPGNFCHFLGLRPNLPA